jgi:hypothetical protein
MFGLYRAQWVGLDGAPKTVNITYHQPIENTKIGYVSFTNIMEHNEIISVFV